MKNVITIIVLIICNNTYSTFAQIHKISIGAMESTLPVGSEVYVINKSFTDTPVEINDIIIFHFPEGDTVISQMPYSSYYMIIRDNASNMQQRLEDRNNYISKARQIILSNYEIKVHSLKEKDKWISRCVALPGDTFSIIDGQVYIDGQLSKTIETLQYRYNIQTNGTRINTEKFDLRRDAILALDYNGFFSCSITDSKADAIGKELSIKTIEKQIKPKNLYDDRIFPHDARYPWNVDNFGPIWIPQKNTTVKIDTSNIALYKRIITAYENNDLEIKDGKILINGEITNEYTFRMDYYWMMGDNRHDSLDSRYWGFVPEDHLTGVATIVIQK